MKETAQVISPATNIDTPYSSDFKLKRANK